MNDIEVKILDHNLNGMPKFLAMLTQRGHKITCMNDLMALYNKVINDTPSVKLLSLPHNTINRMNYITVAIVGLSTKCVSQLRTHATRLTFISTSTQYSAYNKRNNNWTIPKDLKPDEEKLIKKAYKNVEVIYNDLIESRVDRDKAGYILPQGLRKALIIHGNLDAWQYVMSLRLCHRNTLETQHVMKLLYREIEKIGKEFTTHMLPKCYYGSCKEGKFCCGEKYKLEELYK